MLKYGPGGLFSVNSFESTNVSERGKELLANAANHSLAKKTWSSYSTAIKMLERCGEETDTLVSFPLTEDKVLTFLAWLMERNLSTSTINTYLSGIRQAHLISGVEPPVLRSAIINQILEGSKKMDALKVRLGEKPKRLAISPLILRTWKAELIASPKYSNTDKLMLWAIAVLAFQGGFRIHEILSRYNRHFDPSFCLLKRDLTIKKLVIGRETVNIIQVRVKSEKKDRIGVDTLVDVYESNGQFCPVRALMKWRTMSKHIEDDLPAFRWESGIPITGQDLNRCLKSLLEKHFDYNKGKITSHSFRSGIATLMGSLGFADTEIQAIGRWSSRAFESYLKLPRTRRLQMAREIGRLNL